MIPTPQEEAPPRSPGGWTLDTLYTHMSTNIMDLKNRVSDAFASRDRATELNRTTTLESIRNTAQDVKEKFANTNEWRGVVNDLISQKVDRAIVDGLLARVERLEAAKNQRLESHREGASIWSIVIAAIGLIALIVGMLIARK